ncbi:hypothetical protein [Photobacterium sp. OFAV2-7]|uniref:hypothetical protein n=1 Tax=Photobacterium sp. OFAV2-7 TaxID=2917748 RepID=UPI001EF4000D|nr:hypothetical protein [Photobacterium sp. OFAV2-7]MCG7585442.1 hypothetical protein [Photobacterium sp. OFAV2-7]
MEAAQRNINSILNGITNAFKNQHPAREVTRSWQARNAYQNRDLEPGVLTVVYTGEIPNDAYATYIRFLVIGRVYCGMKAKGLDVEQAELSFLQQWREFCSSSTFGNISMTSVQTSQQQEAPDGWFIAECKAGPYDLAGEIDWLPVGPSEVPEQIMASQSPDIGFGHEADYFPVSDSDL